MTTTAYRARWLIDGIRDAPLRDATLVVERGRILRVATDGGLPPGTDVVDLGDSTLLPGLIDCHVHLPFDASADPVAALAKLSIPSATLRAYRHAHLALERGATTVRDVSSPHGIAIGLREAIESGIVDGPRILACGSHISITGGHGNAFGIEVDGVAEVRKAVRLQIKAGADLIKVMGTGGVYSYRQLPESVQLLFDEVKAAVEVAHRAGRRVACHAEGAEGIAIALEAGVDTIEHGNHLSPELAKRMAELNAYLVPTVGAFRAVVASDNVPEEYRAKARRLVEASNNCLKYAQEYGVKVACGTDSGTAMNMPWTGHHLAQEIQYLVDIGGFSPMAAVRAATAVAARAIDLESRIGTLEADKLADFVVVSGHAIEDLNRLATPTWVVKEGVVLYRRDARRPPVRS